jgi:hypothetical protein
MNHIVLKAPTAGELQNKLYDKDDDEGEDRDSKDEVLRLLLHFLAPFLCFSRFGKTRPT